MAEAEYAVNSLLRVHLGIDDDAESYAHAEPKIRGFRDLFAVPSLAAHAQKTQLLAAAERSGCAAVIMDVLLFLSQTMATDVFHRELSKAPACQQHWVQYLLAQQQQQQQGSGVDNGEIANEARVSSLLSTLLMTKTNTDDIAIMLLGLIFKPDTNESLVSTLAVTKEVLRIAKRTKPYRLPIGIISLLEEFIELSDIQLETERRDAFNAPLPQELSQYFDKRARGATSVNANWRMRHFQLTETTLSYSKHDADKLAQSRNPFLDKRVKGTVTLNKQMPVQPLNYAGKVSRRPYCIAIGHGDDALIIDTCTPVVQSQWMAAIAGNIRRLDLDEQWRRYPRPSVLRMSLQKFIEYALFYHSGQSAVVAECDPDKIMKKFKANERRSLFLRLRSLAQRGEWPSFEAIALSGSKTSLFTPSSSASASSAIGYGAMLDLAEQFHAPLGTVAKLEALYEKHERKKPVWTCHSKTHATHSDTVAVEIDVSRTSSSS